MEAFDAYMMYLAMKRHFTPGSGYDFIKYQGKTNASRNSFETRKDKYSFHKLSKKSDPQNFLVANFAEHGHNIWVGELVAESKYQDTYDNWLKRQESMSYAFTNDLAHLDDDFDSNFKVVDGQYPKLLQLYMRKKVSAETIIILDGFLNFLDVWNKKIQDPSLWPDLYFLYRKYTPFVKYDRAKMKKILLDRI